MGYEITRFQRRKPEFLKTRCIIRFCIFFLCGKASYCCCSRTTRKRLLLYIADRGPTGELAERRHATARDDRAEAVADRVECTWRALALVVGGEEQ